MTTPRAPARQRWLIPTLIVVLSVTIGGGLLLREVYRPAVIEQPSTAPPLPESSSLSPGEQPGPGLVVLSPDVLDHPQSQAVNTLIQDYFDAINKKDYPKWLAAVSAERRQTKTKAEWQSDYRSTKDGSILVYRVETVSPGQLRVFVGFTSTQDLVDAPSGFPETCVRWRLILPVVSEENRLRVDVTLTGTPEREKC
jgi:hypothetical protein